MVELLVVNSVLGVAQLLTIVIGYALAIRRFRMVRASAFLERFHSAEMTKARTTVDDWFASGNLSERLRSVNEADNAATLNEIRMFANFFQELGIAWKTKLVDRSYARNCFDVLVCFYWEVLSGWIADYRHRSNPTLYRKFEDLYNEMQKSVNHA